LEKDRVLSIPGYDPCSGSGRYTFDEDLARAGIEFFHTELRHCKGPKAGEPFILEPWQWPILANLFGWVDDEGRRRYREAFLFLPRKNGKSPLAAGIICYMLFELADIGAEIVGAASEYGQASIVWEHARGFVAQNTQLSARCKLYSGQSKAIQLGEEEGWATYKVVASSSSSLHGGNLTAAVIDELHAIDNPEMVNTITTGFAGKPDPLLIHITTADYDRESICNEKYDYAVKVRDGLIDDPAFLPVIYEAGREDDWTDREVWAKANPNLGVSVMEEYLTREVQRAQDQPTYENAFKRLHLNIRTKQVYKWLDSAVWDACGTLENVDELKGQRCYGGLDVATRDDLAAFVLIFPDNGNAILPFFWMPSDNIGPRTRSGVPYETWHREGLIHATSGASVDEEYIWKDIIRLAGEYRIEDIAFDPWGAEAVKTKIMAENIEVTDFRQTLSNFAAPTRATEVMVKRGEIRHTGHKVLGWCMSNVAIYSDANDNMRPDKKHSSDKIDGAVALIMAVGNMMLNADDSGSVYDSRGMVEL